MSYFTSSVFMYLIVFITIIQGTQIYGQSKQEVLDSLYLELQKAPKDEQKARLCNKLAFRWQYINSDSALAYSEKALYYAKNAESPVQEANAYNIRGMILSHQGRYKLALNFYEKALVIQIKQGKEYNIAAIKNSIGIVYRRTNYLKKAIFYFEGAQEIFSRLGEKSAEAQARMNLGICYDHLGGREKALEYYYTASIIFNELSDRSLVADIYLNIGKLYERSKNYSVAIEHYQKALQMYQSDDVNDQVGVVISFCELGDAYSKTGNYAQAMNYLVKSLRLQEKLKSELYLAKTLLDIGRIHFFLNEYDKAESFYQQSWEVAERTQNRDVKASICHQKGLLQQKSQNFQGALNAFKQGMEIAQEIQAQSTIRNILLDLSKIYAEQGDYQKAYETQLNYVQLNDTLEADYREAENLEDHYQKEREKNLQIESEKQQQQAQLEKLTLLVYALMIGGVLVAGLLLSLIRIYRNGQKNIQTEQDLQLKKQEIEDLITNQELKYLGGILDGQAEERGRIAKDLHDRLGNHLTLVKFNLDALEEPIKSLDAKVQEQYGKTVNLLSDAKQEVRKIAYDIASGILSHFGLISALEDLKEKIQSISLIEIVLLNVGFENRRLKASLERHVFQIVQELMSNILNHAEASLVEIQLFWKEKELNLIVEDNGKGFDTEKCHPGMGLKNIQARLSTMDGVCTIDSQSGFGTSVIIDIPIPDSSEIQNELDT